MAHISSLGSGIFSYLDFHAATPASSVDTAAEYAGLFITANSSAISRLPSVREFPSIGTPANIVNVPVYGQATSSQVQGQADAPSLEVTVNYVASEMDSFHTLVGTQGAFRFMMCDAATTLAASLNTGTTALAYGNTEFYFTGKIEAILVNPQLTDAITATMTLSTQSDFFGPATLP
jgi:hypothetical protein